MLDVSNIRRLRELMRLMDRHLNESEFLLIVKILEKVAERLVEEQE